MLGLEPGLPSPAASRLGPPSTVGCPGPEQGLPQRLGAAGGGGITRGRAGVVRKLAAVVIGRGLCPRLKTEHSARVVSPDPCEVSNDDRPGAPEPALEGPPSPAGPPPSGARALVQRSQQRVGLREPCTGGPPGLSAASPEKPGCHMCLERRGDFPGCCERECDCHLGAASANRRRSSPSPSGAPAAPLQTSSGPALGRAGPSALPGVVPESGWAPGLPPRGWHGRKEEGAHQAFYSPVFRNCFQGEHPQPHGHRLSASLSLPAPAGLSPREAARAGQGTAREAPGDRPPWVPGCWHLAWLTPGQARLLGASKTPGGVGQGQMLGVMASLSSVRGWEMALGF